MTPKRLAVGLPPRTRTLEELRARPQTPSRSLGGGEQRGGNVPNVDDALLQLNNQT